MKKITIDRKQDIKGCSRRERGGPIIRKLLVITFIIIAIGIRYIREIQRLERLIMR